MMNRDFANNNGGYNSRYDDRNSSYGGGGSSGFSSNGGGGGGRFGPPSGSFGSGKFDGAGMGANLQTINWNSAALPVFEKNFYIEHPAVSARTESECEEWRTTKGITVIGKGIPKVISSFPGWLVYFSF
jgi:ATP-dependent RNA helicase DDX5/DBP2